MRCSLRHQLWITAAAAVVFFVGLGSAGLWDEDEPLYATCAREMFQRADWVLPTYNGTVFPEKPPLLYWLMIAGFRWFGTTEFAVRVFSAVFGVGTALVTYHLGRRLFNREVGFWAGLIVASTIIFTVSARAATVDSVLVFLTTAAIYVFVRGGIGKQREPGREPPGIQPDPKGAAGVIPTSWAVFALMYALLGIAVLAKGPVGAAVPLGVLGLFGLVVDHLGRTDGWHRRWDERLAKLFAPSPAADSRARHNEFLRFTWQVRTLGAIGVTWAVRCCGPLGPRRIARVAWRLRPLSGLLIIAAIALPWYVMVGLRTEGEFLKVFFGEQNFGRMLKPMQGHSGPVWYYVPAVLIGFFPWSVFLGPTLIDMVRGLRQRQPWREGYLLLACWVGLVVVFWSLVSTKLPHYVLPAYPALALLTGSFIHHWLTQPDSVGRWWQPAVTWTMVGVGVGMLAVVPLVVRIFVPGEEVVALVGLIPIVAGVLFHRLVRHDRRQRAMAVFAAGAVVLLVAMFGWAAVRVDGHQNARPMMTAIRRDSPAEPQLAAYRFLRESTVYYAGQTVTYCGQPEKLRQFLEQSRRSYVFTHSAHEADLEEQFPGEFRVLVRRPRFLGPGEVLVLARRTDSAAARTAEKSSRARHK